MLVSYQDLKIVHFELSESCNANCPMCPRSDNGGPVNPHLKGHQLTIDVVQKTFPKAVVEKLEGAHFCGNFGDPMAAKDALEIVTHFRTLNPQIRMMFNTNGGARSPQWWAKLGEQMQTPESWVVFGIDGLESTNHLYRRNVNWDKLMANVKAFIGAGGQARWEYLIFKHNQHQCEEAEALSKELGFKEFSLKKTARFYDFVSKKVIPFPVWDEAGKTIGFIDPPDEELQNSTYKKLISEAKSEPELLPQKPQYWKKRAREIVSRRYQTVLEALRPRTEPASDLNCIHTNEKSVYISARGEVLPCCFWGGQIRYTDPGEDGRKISAMASRAVGSLENASIRKQSLEKLMSGKWFRAIDKSLSSAKNSNNRVGTCGRLCTRNSEIVKNEFY